jgi:outer membrane lipoprotein-sorting protein
MKSCFKKQLLVAFALGLSPTPQPVIAMASLQEPESHRATVKKIENYLNGIATLQANFVQHNPNGETTTGRMFLKRLGTASFGKLRLEYAPPARMRIIANGETLRHEDEETGEVNDYSIDNTPASFLLRHKIDFSKGDLEVQKMEIKGDKIYLDLIRSGDEGIILTLIFVTSPLLRLQEWTVLDGQGNKTHVILTNVEIGIPLEDTLFRFE